MFTHSQFLQRLDSLIETARTKGLSVRRACQIARVHPTTVTRWKSERFQPRMAVFTRFEQAIVNYQPKQEATR